MTAGPETRLRSHLQLLQHCQRSCLRGWRLMAWGPLPDRAWEHLRALLLDLWWHRAAQASHLPPWWPHPPSPAPYKLILRTSHAITCAGTCLDLGGMQHVWAYVTGQAPCHYTPSECHWAGGVPHLISFLKSRRLADVLCGAHSRALRRALSGSQLLLPRPSGSRLPCGFSADRLHRSCHALRLKCWTGGRPCGC